MGARRILFVDAYDSFSHNIVSLIYRCCSGVSVSTIHIDTDVTKTYGLSLDSFVSAFDAIVLGPGPGDPRNPTDIGLFKQVLEIAIPREIPLLGVCLGFQVLCAHFGHEVVRLPLPCHGQSKSIRSKWDDIFEAFRDYAPLMAISYNSLGVHLASFSSSTSSTPSESFSSSTSTSGSCSPATVNSSDDFQGVRNDLKVLAWDDDGFVMSVRHVALPLWAVQFHPESCGSSHTSYLIRSWWSSVETIWNSGSYKRKLRSEETNTIQEITKAPLHLRQKLSGTSNDKVCWSMANLKSVCPQTLSSLCHDASKDRPIAMLESSAKDRHNIYAIPSDHTKVIAYADGHMLTIVDGDVLEAEKLSVHEAIIKIEELTKTMPNLGGCPKVPFWGGWIGFMSYEIGLDLLGVDSSAVRLVPDFALLCVERSIVQDASTHDVYVQSVKPNDDLWVEETLQTLKKLNDSAPVRTQSGSSGVELTEILKDTRHTLPEHDDYIEKIITCQHELHKGNSYELCLTAEAQLDFPHLDSNQTYALYRNLNKHNPVPRAAYLHFPSTTSDKPSSHFLKDLTVLSSSPEQFLTCSRDGVLDMMPMKGTVQRTPNTTYADAEKILHTPKETAENLMIADLIRHDLYAVGESQQQLLRQKRGGVVRQNSTEANLRTIKIDKSSVSSRVGVMALNSIKQFETVYQLVSHITLGPPPELDTEDADAVISHNHAGLPHVLPPGSMTGAPKKRSCEILQRLERRNRGVYSGIIGFMDVGGACSWSVAIRTAFSTGKEDYVVNARSRHDDGEIGALRSERRQIWRIGAGGAITVLSKPEAEWEEMMGKLGNVLKAFKYVKAGV